MSSSQPEDSTASSPESSRPPSARQSIPSSSYLTVPSSGRTHRTRLSPPHSSLRDPEDIDNPQNFPIYSSPESLQVPPPTIVPPAPPTSPRSQTDLLEPQVNFAEYPDPIYMSVYSLSSVDSEYSNPPARSYSLPSFENMSSSRKITLVCFFLQRLQAWLAIKAIFELSLFGFKVPLCKF